MMKLRKKKLSQLTPLENNLKSKSIKEIKTQSKIK